MTFRAGRANARARYEFSSGQPLKARPARTRASSSSSSAAAADAAADARDDANAAAGGGASGNVCAQKLSVAL